MRLTFPWLVGGALLLLGGSAPAEILDPGDPPLGLPPVPVPEENPITKAKVELGEQLFKEKRFSGNGSISCSHCHKPQMAFTDGLPIAQGIRGKKGTRHTPTVINAVYYKTQFWDGRRESLETQALDPLTNPVEHGLKSHGAVLDVVRDDADYREQFREVFGVAPGDIKIGHVTKAIAAFERTQVSGNSPFDRYLFGGEQDAISESAKRGLKIFRNKGRCVDCHTIEQNYATFTDNEFHNLGVGFDRIRDELFTLVDSFRRMKQQDKKGDIDNKVLTDKKVTELGRFAVTLDPQDVGRFKTPTLRNVAVTPPYMHDGSEETLMEVVKFYNRGGNQNPLLDGGIKQLDLTEQEQLDLVNFMKTLTSPRFSHLAKDGGK
ncbi:cytochrome-c peroxidase [Thiohalorhabdus sp. Cl-TMA]|uniref:Cytochrome-c peroxidase n=1 Tax=Thiohalorhabdus methylotrophus TaxID=3242694 RepID=A0ABV4TVM6_9GAMM